MKTLDEIKDELWQTRIDLRDAKKELEESLAGERELASKASLLVDEVEGMKLAILRLEKRIDDVEDVDDE